MPGFDAFHVPEKDRDPKFIYRWVNTKDRNVLDRKWKGWEVCTYDQPETLLGAPPVSGQATDAPTGGVTRQRGDLVLMRMPRDVHAETIGRTIREARERQTGTLESMIDEAESEMQRRAVSAGLATHGKRLVFRDGAQTETQDQ